MKCRNFFYVLVVMAVLLTSCSQPVSSEKSTFVRIENKHFVIGEETFFPLMLNYIVSFQGSHGQFLVTPSLSYDSCGYADAVGEEAVRNQLLAHFGLIRDLGFNTIRVCFDRLGQDGDGRYFYQADRKFYLDKKSDRQAILQGLGQMVDVAEQQDLKVMLLIKPPFKEDSDLQLFTKELLEYFQKNPTLFAYDFMNEPLYFDPASQRSKLDAFAIVCHWKWMVKKYAPNQLFTIGFSEPIEVFEWDCSLLPVDFVEIHSYHPLRVPSEIYWYSRYCGKPWMIGETGLPADNDSITYGEQAQFVTEAYQLTRDAGGCGFGLWEFQECKGGTYEASYTGLLTHGGVTRSNRGGDFLVKGTLKLAARIIATLEQNYTPRPYQRPVNYYNMLGYKNIRISGRIIDRKTGMGVDGAVIRGWNDDWSVGMNTYSDANGHFNLYCNDLCTHFEISAAGYTKIKFDKNVALVPQLASEEIQDLPERGREYHQISYHPFVRKSIADTSFFQIMEFEPSLFGHANWDGSLGELHLQKIACAQK